jgi:branched-chain amino acid transport system ATP-binding protein
LSLEIKNVTLKFGGLTALDNVSFSVVDGALCAVVGPNGAGKTALLNCINGVYRPNQGSILVDGRDVTSIPVHKIALAKVGRAFQHSELFPHMTVTENLLVGRHLLMQTGILSGAVYFGRARREEIKERKIVEDIIDFFELYRYRDVAVSDLPYGVQKLVGVARALALEPKLLLLDEPSTGLMREEKENFARFLLRIRHEMAVTILWVEHDMKMVTDLADKIVVLSYGEVIAQGAPDVVRRDPRVIEAYLGTDTSRVGTG